MRCPFCLHEAYVVEVHGHTQCAKCRNPIQRCCEGEVCNTYEDDSSVIGDAPSLTLSQNRPSSDQALHQKRPSGV